MAQIPAEETAALIGRLHRVQGQLGGIVRMVEQGRECEDIVTQLAAASKALERAGFTVIASGLKECLRTPGGDEALESERLQRLFLSLA
jgi:DNA-binding FrmR family transcriptional regulator